MFAKVSRLQKWLAGESQRNIGTVANEVEKWKMMKSGVSSEKILYVWRVARGRIDTEGIRVQDQFNRQRDQNSEIQKCPVICPLLPPPRPSSPVRLSPTSVGVNGPGPRFRWYGHIWYTDRYMHHTVVRARSYIDYQRRKRGTMECNQRRHPR